MQKIYIFLLKWIGWSKSVTVEIPDKCILCVAPHTSNWDFIIGLIFYKSLGRDPYFLMKKEWFFFPMKYLLRSYGGIPVDRSRKSSVSEQMVKFFKTKKYFQLAVTPEGTRKRTEKWKSGFYYIAMKSEVPITLAYIDYARKIIGIEKIFYPTGDKTRDINEIKQYFKGVTARHPHKFAI